MMIHPWGSMLIGIIAATLSVVGYKFISVSRPVYSHTCLIRTFLIRHFRLIRPGNLTTVKALSSTSMLSQPFN